MRTVLVGSQALHGIFPDEVNPQDTDYFISEEVRFKSKMINGEKIEFFYHPDIFKWKWGQEATLDELYTIKVSHAFWALKNNSWDKHMYYIAFMQNKGAKFIPELYDILHPIWKELHGEKKANLNTTAEEFFNSNVPRIYDHDSIHKTIAYYDEPLFKRILKENSEVAVDKEKFDNLSHEDKIKLVREEVYATALERKSIPSDYQEHYRRAYDYALMKTITSFSKGWFPLFIILNYSVLRKPDHNFHHTHLNNKDKLILLPS